MSILQDDKKVIHDGRKNALENAEVDLRDQIVHKLHATLTEEEVGPKLQKAWTQATNNIDSVLKKQQTYLADLDDFNLGETESKFGGVSNIHLPTSFIVCKTYHARFLEAILGIDPPFSVKARKESSTDRVQVVEDLLRYTLNDWANCYHGIEREIDTWIWNWCTTGTGIMKLRWNTKWESWLDVKKERVALPPIYQVTDSGETIAIPQWGSEEREVEVTKKVFDGPQYDFVHLEDFRMIGGGGDPDMADIVMHRSRWTASDLWTKVDQGVFNEEAVSAIIEAGPSVEGSSAGAGIKAKRKEASGVAQVDTDTDLDRYEIIECCFRYDVIGNGINSDLVAWLDLRSGQILGATYLRRIMPSGERPYSVIHFHQRPGEDFGLGLLEILHPLSVELDAMHNIRIDNAIFQSIPFFFYRASSSLDPETFQVEPGMGIPLDNPQTDVYFPNVGNRTSFTAQEEQVIQSYVERLTGISDLALGVMSGTQGATRTASGVRALLGENNNNLSVHLRRLNAGVKKLLRTTWHMLQNRVEPGFCFRITGDDGRDIFRKVYETDLAQDVDFELSANTSNSNKSVQIEVAQQLMSMTMNPLNIQMGISGPSEIYAAQKSYLSALGLKDVHRYIKKPQDYHHAMTPQEEFNRVIGGEQVAVAPQADHAGFIAFAKTMLDLQAEARTLEPEQEQRAIDQMKAHEAMAQALEAQQSQVAVQQQMVSNAAQSGAQAPAALNPLAGTDPSQMF